MGSSFFTPIIDRKHEISKKNDLTNKMDCFIMNLRSETCV